MWTEPIDRAEVERLCRTLRTILTDDSGQLCSMAAAITNDTAQILEHDRVGMVKCLDGFVQDFYAGDGTYKPKGTVLVLLSYNEPFIMNILPILQALAAGNIVYVRPSSAALEFTRYIWQKAAKHHPLITDRLQIIDDDYDSVYRRIPMVQAVYFFGSLHNAKKVGQACATHSVEFWPETEGADHAVYFDGAVPDTKLPEFSEYCLRSAYTHSGQICQRLQGIFVQTESVPQVVAALKDAYARLMHKDIWELVPRVPSLLQTKLYEGFRSDAQASGAKECLPMGDTFAPTLVIEPDSASALCRTAYFLPTFWVASFRTHEDLVGMLADRPLHFGLNIWCADSELAARVIDVTAYTRYTVNTEHVPIRPGEGWGGAPPTSYGGYMNWRAKFSNPYTILYA